MTDSKGQQPYDSLHQHDCLLSLAQQVHIDVLSLVLLGAATVTFSGHAASPSTHAKPQMFACVCMVLLS